MIEAHILKSVPEGLTVELTQSRALTPAIKYRADDAAFQIASAVFEELYGRPPAVGYVGGGVPVLAYMRQVTGRNLITFGFQREDENFHAPNEYMRLSDFKMGQRAYARLLHAHRGQPVR